MVFSGYAVNSVAPIISFFSNYSFFAARPDKILVPAFLASLQALSFLCPPPKKVTQGLNIFYSITLGNFLCTDNKTLLEYTTFAISVVGITYNLFQMMKKDKEFFQKNIQKMAQKNLEVESLIKHLKQQNVQSHSSFIEESNRLTEKLNDLKNKAESIDFETVEQQKEIQKLTQQNNQEDLLNQRIMSVKNKLEKSQKKYTVLLDQEKEHLEEIKALETQIASNLINEKHETTSKESSDESDAGPQLTFISRLNPFNLTPIDFSYEILENKFKMVNDAIKHIVDKGNSTKIEKINQLNEILNKFSNYSKQSYLKIFEGKKENIELFITNNIIELSKHLVHLIEFSQEINKDPYFSRTKLLILSCIFDVLAIYTYVIKNKKIQPIDTLLSIFKHWDDQFFEDLSKNTGLPNAKEYFLNSAKRFHCSAYPNKIFPFTIPSPGIIGKIREGIIEAAKKSRELGDSKVLSLIKSWKTFLGEKNGRKGDNLEYFVNALINQNKPIFVVLLEGDLKSKLQALVKQLKNITETKTYPHSICNDIKTVKAKLQNVEAEREKSIFRKDKLRDEIRNKKGNQTALLSKVARLEEQIEHINLQYHRLIGQVNNLEFGFKQINLSTPVYFDVICHLLRAFAAIAEACSIKDQSPLRNKSLAYDSFSPLFTKTWSVNLSNKIKEYCGEEKQREFLNAFNLLVMSCHANASLVSKTQAKR